MKDSECFAHMPRNQALTRAKHNLQMNFVSGKVNRNIKLDFQDQKESKIQKEISLHLHRENISYKK